MRVPSSAALVDLLLDLPRSLEAVLVDGICGIQMEVVERLVRRCHEAGVQLVHLRLGILGMRQHKIGVSTAVTRSAGARHGIRDH